MAHDVVVCEFLAQRIRLTIKEMLHVFENVPQVRLVALRRRGHDVVLDALDLLHHGGSGSVDFDDDSAVVGSVKACKMTEYPGTLICRYFRCAEFSNLNETVSECSPDTNNSPIGSV